MSIVACDTACIEWTYAGFEILKVEASNQTQHAGDILDNLVHLMTWMYETGIVAMKTRSVLPFLFSDQNCKALNDEFDDIMARRYEFEAGSPDLPAFFEKVNKCIARIAKMKGKIEGPPARWLQIRYEKLTEILLQLEKQRRANNFQEQPIGLALTGGSRTGKSRLRDFFAKVALGACGHEWDESRVVTEAKRDAMIVVIMPTLLFTILMRLELAKEAISKIVRSQTNFLLFSTMLHPKPLRLNSIQRVSF
jgi:hypothetical protein